MSVLVLQSTSMQHAADVSKSFDKMNHYGLLIKLMKRHIPNNLLLLLEHWFAICMTCVTCRVWRGSNILDPTQPDPQVKWPTRPNPKLTWNSGPDPTRPILHDIQLSNIRHHDDHMMTIWHKKRPNNLNANNKNLAIANRSRVGCAHNTLRASKTWICRAHRCIQPLVRCRFPYFGADLRLTSPSARHQLTLRDHGPQLVYHATCLFTPQLSPVLIAPAHGGVVQAELTWVAGSAR